MLKETFYYRPQYYKGVFTVTILVFLMSNSCRSSDTEYNSVGSMGTVLVEMNIQGEEFDNFHNIESKASTSSSILSSFSQTQQQEISLNKDLSLIAQLSQATQSAQDLTQTSSKTGMPVSATEVNNIPNGIQYKVVVYKATGEYITERNYIRGQENKTQALNLYGGNSYTFIAYSVNSNTALPSITFTNSQNKTLATSNISGLSGSSDIMYFRKDMLLSPNQVNYLNIVFKHKFSQITTYIDASLSGYNITAINAGYNSHFPTAFLQLSNATITRTGTVGNVNIVFPALNTQIITSTPTIINGNTTTGSLQINSITIGSISRSNITAFTNKLIITPGVKYNLTLNITPVDTYLDHIEQKAVRINGKIWMRYNLGADISLNPDSNPSVQGLYGNYYQWGEIQETANAYTPSAAIPGWRGTGYAWKGSNAWNSGTETLPVKVLANDPCPNGYRIPTKTEYEALIAATTHTNIGTWLQGENNFSAAKVFTSKRNKNVQLTFPAAGFRDAYAGSLFDSSYMIRGDAGYYRTSTATYEMSIFEGQVIMYPDAYKSWGESIRCIAE